MSATRLNCWEYMKCNREPGGRKVPEKGVCPAATDSTFDGINLGKNAGRICWAVAGTCCGGVVQGTFAEKRESCTSCQFYKLVQKEEETYNYANKFLNHFSEEEKRSLLNKMACKAVRAGERFISQGEVLETAYIIQRGSCLLVVEKGGELHPGGHLGRGDLVGVTSVLTGEPQNAHAEAETAMELWVLNRSLFDDISKANPDLLDFLTEIVAGRFDSKRPVADRVIGKYITSEIIGRGAFSIVYKGYHSGLNIPVAIKMMRHNMVVDPDFQRNFRNEAKIIASLNNKNIIRVYDIEERYQTLFIIEELVEGESLKDLLVRLKRIPVKLTVNYLLQIAYGLQYAHQKNIIHRDINPSNIFVQQNDQVKILDFGLACPVGTEDFTSLGTLAYMAPEQIQSDALDERIDIYALGITAFEMLTGLKPYLESENRRLMHERLKDEIPDPGDHLPHLPTSIGCLVRKASRRDPQKRHQNISELLVDLHHTAEEIGLESTPKKIEPYKMASFFLSYQDNQQNEFKELMTHIHAQAERLGIQLKSADLKDNLIV